MFENLSARLEAVFRRLRGRGRLTPGDVDAALREVRMALLEADVHYQVARDFVAQVREEAVGQEVLGSLTPGQQVVKVVYDHLSSLMGGRQSRLQFSPSPPTVFMMVGLQGSGKTTTAAKLALKLRQEGHFPLLCAADTRRPAAAEQLGVLAQEVGVPCFQAPGAAGPESVCRQAVGQARSRGLDVVLLDTGGRLHVDDELMEELVRIKAQVQPQETLLVLDAMTGQDAVNSARAFAGRVGLDGVILTKLDGDARGGAALSVRAVTGCPIKFVGLGEGVAALEPFHPDRMAARILGMGDILSLVEKAQTEIDEAEALELERKLRAQEFTLDDFLDQLKRVERMGPLDQVLAMVPGFGRLKHAGVPEVDPGQLRRVRAMIGSMTSQEKRDPSIIGGSRRRRIAAGSGTTVQDVNRLLKQFDQARRLLKQLSEAGRKGPKGPGVWRAPFRGQ